MESRGYEHVFAGLSAAKSNRTIAPRELETHGIFPWQSGPSLGDRNSPHARDLDAGEILADAAVLFALAAQRYRLKWEPAHDPRDVAGYLTRLVEDARFGEVVALFAENESWSTRPDIPRMFFRETAKLMFIAKQLRTAGEADIIDAPAAARWIMTQEAWPSMSSTAADDIARYSDLRQAARETACAKQIRRTAPEIQVERRRIGETSHRPKVNVDGQLSYRELKKRREEKA